MACHGMGMRRKNEYGDFFPEENVQWRSTRWWQSLNTRMMKEDPMNRTRWKHKYGWHNRRNMWDKMATCWAGEEDWTIARKKQNSPEEKYKFTSPTS